jgi:predicted regulator of Ras-like GTPase activity (Roadblock/LC7/MglB family)
VAALLGPSEEDRQEDSNLPEQSHAEKMRHARLVFYAEDVNKIDGVLDEFLSASQARAVLLIDSEGHLVTKKGMTSSFDTDSLSALVAGSFASTRELARILGEAEFSVIFHQGQNENIQISMAGERALLVIIFDDRTTVGMVRIYCQELSNELAGIFKAAADRFEKEGAEDIDDKYEQAAQDRLDEFFSESK